MLALGAPLAAAQAVQFLINATVVVLIGRLGPESLAAIALGNSLHFTVVMFCLGVTVTVSALVARALGHGDVRKAAPILHQGLWVATVLGVPGTLLTWNGGLLLAAFGHSAEIVALASDYLRPLSLSMVPALWFVAFRAFVAAHSRPRAVLLVTGAGLLFNAALSYVLIFGHFGLPAMGLVGAGIGITATNVFMALAMGLYLVRARVFRAYRLFHGLLAPDWPVFREIWKVGVPIGGATVLEVGYFNVCLQLMGRIGTDELAAHQVTLQLAAISFMVPLGFGQAATVRVGLRAGGGDAAGAARAGWTALALGLVGVSIAALLFVLLPHGLIGLFMPLDEPGNARAIGFAVTFLMVVAAFQLFDATQTIMLGALRGLKDTRTPMWLAAFGYWVVGLGLSLLLGFQTPLGGLGIWIGAACGLAAAALLLTLRFVRMAHARA
jgi:MATE family multidrug resistance protein